MTNTDVAFLDFNDQPLATPANVNWVLDWANHLAVGGDDQANLLAYGPRARLWALRSLLGQRVITYDDRGDVTFHGLVETITWQTGAKKRTLSLRNMANRVAVAYTTSTAAGQERGTTDWSEDQASIDAFGRKERRLSAADVSPAAAASKAATAIARGIAKPTTVLEVTGNGATMATLECIGLYHTLDWVFYANDSGQIIHTGTEVADQPLGQGLTSGRIGFTAGHIHDLDGALVLADPNISLTVTGSISNDGVWISDSQSRREAKSYAAATIFFNAADDIHDDTGQGLAFIDTDDYFEVSGAADGANNGIKKATSASATHLTVDPSTIVTAAASPTITISRGTKVAIAGNLTNEFPAASASVTVTVHGTKLFQMFQLPTNVAWTAAEIGISVQLVGTPTDSIKVSLTTVSNSQPGTTLDSATIAASALDEEMAERVFTLANTVSMAPGSTYGILVERTGANSAANYYKVEVDNLGGYTGGLLRRYTGAAWTDSVQSLQFRVSGAQQTTTQISDILSDAGQFIAAIDAQVTSGVSTNQYRDGDQTALSELLALLELGTAAGERILFDISPQRVIRIRTQPTAADSDWLITDDGEVVADGRRPIRNARRIAGRWLQTDDVPPAVGYLSDMRRMFAEAAEMPADGPPQLSGQGEAGAWDL